MQSKKHIEELKKDFRETYDLYADALFRFSYYKLSDREKAKDIVQDTFVRFWEYIASDGEVENVKAFLYRIAHNAIIDNYRKKKEISLDVLEEEGFDPRDHDMHHSVSRGPDARKALELINQLDDSESEVMLMRYVDSLSVKEIAMILDERENTVSVKIHRALKHLQELFEEVSFNSATEAPPQER